MLISHRTAPLLAFAISVFSVVATAQSIAIGRSSLTLPEPARWSVSEVKSPGVSYTGDASGTIPLDGKLLVYRPDSGAIKAMLISRVTKGGVALRMRWHNECPGITASQYLYKRDRSSSDDVDCLIVIAIARTQQFIDSIPSLKNDLGGLVADGGGVYYVAHVRSVGSGGMARSQVLISQDFKGMEGIAVDHGTQLPTTVLAWAEQFARSHRDAILSFSGNWTVPPLMFGAETGGIASIAPSNRPQPRESAPAPAPAPAPVAGPTGGGAIGTLVMTDSLTGIKSNLEVAVQDSSSDRTAYSTGDVIAKDGRVLQVRIGEAVLRVVSGALWTIPPVAGASGDAKIERADVAYKSPGEIGWKAVAAGGGKVRIEANVAYMVEWMANSYMIRASGKWIAVYSIGHQMPDTFSVAIRGQSNFGTNMVSAELKWR